MLPISGYENYLISSYGEVINNRTGKRLKPDINNCGYERVTLSKDGKTKRFFIHRLVALHYIPNPTVATNVNHKDGNKRNNQENNLEWASCSENHLHAFRTGLKANEENHHNAVYTNELIQKACEMIAEGKKRGEIISTLNLPKHLIDDLRRKRSWVTISNNYF